MHCFIYFEIHPCRVDILNTLEIGQAYIVLGRVNHRSLIFLTLATFSQLEHVGKALGAIRFILTATQERGHLRLITLRRLRVTEHERRILFAEHLIVQNDSELIQGRLVLMLYGVKDMVGLFGASCIKIELGQDEQVLGREAFAFGLVAGQIALALGSLDKNHFELFKVFFSVPQIIDTTHLLFKNYIKFQLHKNV